MRTLKTAEELRAGNALRQKKWRERNKVLARERRLYVYGKAKYPEMVEASSRGAKQGQEEAAKPLNVTNNATVTQKAAPWGEVPLMEPKEKVVWEDRIEVPLEEVELEAKDRKAYEQMFKARARKMAGVPKRPKEQEPDLAGIEAVKAWAASREKRVVVPGFE
jgi:hypothetical protein